jgi:hypothetical protein
LIKPFNNNMILCTTAAVRFAIACDAILQCPCTRATVLPILLGWMYVHHATATVGHAAFAAYKLPACSADIDAAKVNPQGDGKGFYWFHSVMERNHNLLFPASTLYTASLL